MTFGVLQKFAKLVLTSAILVAPHLALAKDGVILIHGFLGNESDMAKIQTRLIAEGYETYNANYNTTSNTVNQMAVEVVFGSLNAMKDVDNVYVVTHSMGGILFRAYSEANDISSVKRVVMLAPPNHGSEVAEELSQYAPYRNFFGPAGTELADIQLTPRKIGDYELGIIAGSSSVNPIFSPILPGKDDGWVSLASTPLLGMNDFVIVPTSHGFITKNDSAIEQVVNFIKQGQFDHTLNMVGMPISTGDFINFYSSRMEAVLE